MTQLHESCAKCGGSAADCLCRQNAERTAARLLEADARLVQIIRGPLRSSDFEDWDQGPASYPAQKQSTPTPGQRGPKHFVFWACVVVIGIVLAIWASGIWR